jgi:hypothetical protein
VIQRETKTENVITLRIQNTPAKYWKNLDFHSLEPTQQAGEELDS